MANRRSMIEGDDLGFAVVYETATHTFALLSTRRGVNSEILGYFKSESAYDAFLETLNYLLAHPHEVDIEQFEWD